MANWKHTIDITREWKSVEDGVMPVYELAASLAAKVAAINTGDEFLDDARDEIVSDFTDFASDKCEDKDDFDGTMEKLYAWADTRMGARSNLCWIET